MTALMRVFMVYIMNVLMSMFVAFMLMCMFMFVW
jgi:hypothetical protein